MKKWESKFLIFWNYVKYQLLTKALFTFLVFPLFSMTVNLLISSSGRTTLSSGDYLSFLFSLQGAGFLLLSFLLATLLIGTDILAFLLISAWIKDSGGNLRVRDILRVSVKSVFRLFSPSGFLLILYIAVVLPLVGFGISIKPMEQFEIPNFILSVIEANPIYATAYYLLLTALFLLSFFHIFFLHYVLFFGKPLTEALSESRRMIRKYWKRFLWDFSRMAIAFVLLVFLSVGVIVAIALSLSAAFSWDVLESRFGTLFWLLFISEVLGFATLMSVPAACHRLTVLFFRYCEKDGVSVLSAQGFQRLRQESLSSRSDAAGGKVSFRKAFVTGAVLFFCVVLFNASVATILALHFDAVFKKEYAIDIVAHRGGGDLAAENSLAGLHAAIREGAGWSEFDVQRTGDGQYIINHDAGFKRVAGVNKKSTEMELEEIRELTIRDAFDPSREPQPVPTLEEYLDTAKGKIGLLIELKGATADRKMVDDVVRMVKDREMQNEVVILSLDYSLIQYVEERYPEMDSGFLYFFAIGSIAKMEGDMLIMEEREATSSKIEEIHRAGKKAVVWTVNTEESIDRFVKSDVDGIITDYVLRVKEGMERRDSRTDFQIILESIFE